MKPDYYIGIDAGTNTGIAVWSRLYGQFEKIETCKIHKAMEIVKGYNEPHFFIKVIVEDARKRKWFGGNTRGKEQGAGSIKRDCSIWEDFLKDLGVDFEMVHPVKGATKWSADAFSKTTKWSERTSSHARDAAMLVYGK